MAHGDAREGKWRGNWRMEWISLPTPFTSAQRLSELPFPCVTVSHHIATGLYRSLSAQRLSELPFPCVTLSHHIATGLYRSLSAQRLSGLPFPCVTVSHHIATGLYRSPSAQRLSERTVLSLPIHAGLHAVTLHTSFPVRLQTTHVTWLRPVSV
jgi:hypothetical protein